MENWTKDDKNGIRFKLMQSMAEVGVTTGDIQHQARKRRLEREIKKGSLEKATEKNQDGNK